MNSVDRASKNDFWKSLKDHLRNEEDYQLRQEAFEASLEERARDLMVEGEEFYPWTFERFEEAIGNAPEVNRRTLFEYVYLALKMTGEDYINAADMVIGKELRTIAENYWLEAAKEHLRKEFDRGFL